MTEGGTEFDKITSELGGLETEGRNTAEYIDNLRWMDKEGLGRAIIETNDFHRGDEDLPNRELLGYILPLEKDTDHLILLTDGSMYHVKANDPYDSRKLRKDYTFSPSHEPVNISVREGESGIAHTKKILGEGHFFGADFTVVNTNDHGNEGEFSILVDQALTRATTALEERTKQEDIARKTQAASVAALNEKMGRFRRKMTPPPGTQPRSEG